MCFLDRNFFFCLSVLQSEIKLISATVFVDPYEEADAKVRIVSLRLFADMNHTNFRIY